MTFKAGISTKYEEFGWYDCDFPNFPHVARIRSWFSQPVAVGELDNIETVFAESYASLRSWLALSSF
jgi:hypothetical protein